MDIETFGEKTYEGRNMTVVKVMMRIDFELFFWQIRARFCTSLPSLNDTMGQLSI